MDSYWRRTIALDEPWFRCHPMREEIIAAEDKSKFLALTLFGDDGTMRKTRMLHTMTWFSALSCDIPHLRSRIPCYMVAGHVLLRNVTEPQLQEAIAWSFMVWQTGRFPINDHLCCEFPPRSVRRQLAYSNASICGRWLCWGIYSHCFRPEMVR